MEQHTPKLSKSNPLKYDLSGETFGRWTAMEWVDSKWKCLCSCGEIRNISSADLRSGKSKSCGCLQREMQKNKKTKHGMTGTRVHRIWKAMWTRCTNPNVRSFQDYKDRTPPSEWKDFAVFYADVGDPPSPMHSIDRIKNDLPYSKDNCRWSLPSEQNRNTKANRNYTFNSETKCLADWADSLGINRVTLLSRLDSGMEFADAISKPIRKLSGRNY